MTAISKEIKIHIHDLYNIAGFKHELLVLMLNLCGYEMAVPRWYMLMMIQSIQ